MTTVNTTTTPTATTTVTKTTTIPTAAKSTAPMTPPTAMAKQSDGKIGKLSKVHFQQLHKHKHQEKYRENNLRC